MMQYIANEIREGDRRVTLFVFFERSLPCPTPAKLFSFQRAKEPTYTRRSVKKTAPHEAFCNRVAKYRRKQPLFSHSSINFLPKYYKNSKHFINFAVLYIFKIIKTKNKIQLWLHYKSYVTKAHCSLPSSALHFLHS